MKTAGTVPKPIVGAGQKKVGTAEFEFSTNFA